MNLTYVGDLLAKFCPLFSGSKGNSFYAGSDDFGVLIDAGRSAKQIENALRLNGIDVHSVQAIFITHEHADHVNGLRVFASRYGIRVFASAGTISALERMGVLNGKFPYATIDGRGVDIDGMSVTPFSTSHDSSESVGYIVKTTDSKKLAFATDIGVVSESVRRSITGCDLVVLESNHDVHMLQSGEYPYYLKRRILSDRGHLSNDACARELPQIVKSGAKHIVLAHLSEENNVPQLAYETSLCSLTMSGFSRGRDFELSIAPKDNLGGELIVF